MPFGKKSLDRLSPAELKRFEEDRKKRYADKAEQKMLSVPPRGTPLGDAAYLSAVERTMVDKPKECSQCHEVKNDLNLELTGTCTGCWQQKP